MTKKEIFDAELDNKDRICLYLEGTFWKAYERSAFRFVKEVKPYLAKKKYVKTIGREMVALGFPDSYLAEVNKRLSLLEAAEKTRVFKARGTYGAEEFDRWKDGIPLTVSHAPKGGESLRSDLKSDDPLHSAPGSGIPLTAPHAPKDGESLRSAPNSDDPLHSAPGSGIPLTVPHAPKGGESLRSAPNSDDPLHSAPGSGIPLTVPHAPKGGESLRSVPNSDAPLHSAPGSGIPLTVPHAPKDGESLRSAPNSDAPRRSEPINEPLNPAAYENLSDESEVIAMLKGFNIESKTPMECMLFLSKLKNKVM